MAIRTWVRAGFFWFEKYNNFRMEKSDWATKHQTLDWLRRWEACTEELAYFDDRPRRSLPLFLANLIYHWIDGGHQRPKRDGSTAGWWFSITVWKTNTHTHARARRIPEYLTKCHSISYFSFEIGRLCGEFKNEEGPRANSKKGQHQMTVLTRDLRGN